MQGDNDGPLDAFGRAFGARVDGASPRGFLRFLSLTAFQAEGCGIARRAMSIKSALRVWLSVSYSMIRILVIGSLRSPPPIRAAPDFHLKVKRLTMICASLALLQIMFAVHPRESVSHDSQVASLPYESCSLATSMQGGRIKHREIFLS